MPGDGKGWALDEDRRQMRQALAGLVQEVSLVKAEIIHTPFWQGLSVVDPSILKEAFVIAHADNPPFFYSKQPEFLQGQQQVDLWVARSKEALEQFQLLKLPVEYIPYTIDPELFFSIADKKLLRKKFGIPEDAYVIANFHRDTEGADLKTPKFQKAPELMVAILQELKRQGSSFHVLLAGPRRHWLRQALNRAGIPFTFVGKKEVEEDDFGINILNRSTLNELINAADLMLIPSRWEGGPQSVMEAAASRCKVLSTPLGLANDILKPTSLYHSISEAADLIVADQQQDLLHATLQPQWERWHQSHTIISMTEGMQQLYRKLPTFTSFQKKVVTSKRSWIDAQGKQILHTTRRRFSKKKLPSVVGWNHHVGKDHDLDEIFLSLGSALRALNISIRPANGCGIEFIGWPTKECPPVPKGNQRLQWITPSMPSACVLRDTLIVAPAVQDIVNLRHAGLLNPAITLPFPNHLNAEKEILSDEPLLVKEGDTAASMKIWRAMAAGRPIVYPKQSAYYEQVFHGGFAFEEDKDIPMLVKMAQEEALSLRLLAKVPTRGSAQKALKKLLEDLL